MAITRVRQSHYPEWEAGGRGDPCAGNDNFD